MPDAWHSVQEAVHGWEEERLAQTPTIPELPEAEGSGIAFTAHSRDH